MSTGRVGKNHCMTMVFAKTARGYLGFAKLWNFNGQYGGDGQSASSCPISWRLVKLLPRYGDDDLSFFQYGGLRHLGSVVRVFGPPTKSIW